MEELIINAAVAVDGNELIIRQGAAAPPRGKNVKAAKISSSTTTGNYILNANCTA